MPPSTTRSTPFQRPASVRRRPPRPAVELEVVIPAYNEAHRLGSTLAAVVRHLEGMPLTAAVVVVDNGSVDGTADVARRAGTDRVPVHVLGCARQGKGAAVRAAVQSSSARWVGFCDADLATPIEALDDVVRLLADGAEVVIGSRRCAGAEILTAQPAMRRLGGKAFRVLSGSAVPGVADTQCGFKFFEGDVARRLFEGCHVDGFAFDVALLAAAARAGTPVVEVPVRWTDVDGSTFRPLRDGVRSVADLVKVRAAVAAGGGAPPAPPIIP